MLCVRGLLLIFASLAICFLYVDAAPVQQLDELLNDKTCISVEESLLRRRDFQGTGLDKPATYFQSLFTSSTGTGIETSITIGGQTFSGTTASFGEVHLSK